MRKSYSLLSWFVHGNHRLPISEKQGEHQKLLLGTGFCLTNQLKTISQLFHSMCSSTKQIIIYLIQQYLHILHTFSNMCADQNPSTAGCSPPILGGFLWLFMWDRPNEWPNSSTAPLIIWPKPLSRCRCSTADSLNQPGRIRARNQGHPSEGQTGLGLQQGGLLTSPEYPEDHNEFESKEIRCAHKWTEDRDRLGDFSFSHLGTLVAIRGADSVVGTHSRKGYN